MALHSPALLCRSEYQPIIRNCYIADQGGKFAFELRRSKAQELCRAFTRGQPMSAAPPAVPRPAAQPAAQVRPYPTSCTACPGAAPKVSAAPCSGAPQSRTFLLLVLCCVPGM